MTHVAGITATVPVALGWRLERWNDGASDVTLTNLARVDHSSAASRVISRRGRGCTRATKRARAKNACCTDSKVKTTSFTGQVDAMVPPPSSGHKCSSLCRPHGHCAVCQLSAASVSILQLKYDSKGSGTCQTDENDKGAGLGVGGRTLDDGQSLTVTWIVYVPPTSNTRLSTV